MRSIATLALALLMAACGGSSEAEDARATIGPVDCRAQPELCR